MAEETSVIDRIKADIGRNDVVLYMMGTPVFPKCGFSSQAAQILGLMGVEFKAVDVTADPGVRQVIKDFSNWPTFPQLYVKGEMIGGCDIMREMYQSGELQQLFDEKGVKYGATPPAQAAGG